MREYKFQGERINGSGGKVYGGYYKKWIYDVKIRNENLKHYIGWQSKDEHGKIWNEYCEVIPETVELVNV